MELYVNMELSPEQEAKEEIGVNARSKKKILSYFEPRVHMFRHSTASVGWTSRKSQEERFDAVMDLGIHEGARILDVGCGIGQFYGFLKKRLNNFEYVGIDLSAAMIEHARNFYPDATFHHADVLDYSSEQRFDYAVAVGVYNVETGDNDAIIRRIIQCMYNLCSRGCAASLTQSDDYSGTIIHSFSPANLEEFGRSLTPHVRLRNDYLPNDFMLYLVRPGNDAPTA